MSIKQINSSSANFLEFFGGHYNRKRDLEHKTQNVIYLHAPENQFAGDMRLSGYRRFWILEKI